MEAAQIIALLIGAGSVVLGVLNRKNFSRR